MGFPCISMSILFGDLLRRITAQPLQMAMQLAPDYLRGTTNL